jgi:hypothetical protein
VSWVAVEKVAGPEISDGVGKFEIDCAEVADPTTKNATGKLGPGTAKKDNTRCGQLAAEYKECQARDAQIAREQNRLATQTYTGMSPGAKLDFNEERDAQVQSYQDLRKRNRDRMDQIADEQRRLGCPDASVSSDPAAASATASSYSGPA